MITPQDLQEAIAFYGGKVNPDPSDGLMLAACYIIQDHMYPQKVQEPQTYSLAAEPPKTQLYSYSGADTTVGEYGDSDFLITISGKAPAAVWSIIDNLMDTMRVSYPRVYNRVMREIREL